MPAAKKKKEIKSYDHRGQGRSNNPAVGLVNADTDVDAEPTMYEHDPHIDPHLSWAGKTENTSFEVPTVSLHVHERIDPRTIIDAVKLNGTGGGAESQVPLFELEEENPPRKKAIEFYQHKHNWKNRLIAGDSLLVMNSLLQKEGLGGQVQMVYMDPPFGIKYGSNFQPFTNQMEVKDRKAEDLTAEPEMLKAFRDTWELGIHSYLSYMRDRLFLAKKLLTESGSCFVQIGKENVHRVALLMDEVFGAENRVATISFAVANIRKAKFLPEIEQYILWYTRNKDIFQIRKLFEHFETDQERIDFLAGFGRVGVEFSDGKVSEIEKGETGNYELPTKEARLFRTHPLYSAGRPHFFEYEWNGKLYKPSEGCGWRVDKDGMDKLCKQNRLNAFGDGQLRWKEYENEIPGRSIANFWSKAMQAPKDKSYAVETSPKALERCILMATDPGDIVLDPTCGSGTTAFVAEQWGRRWITCDTSRVALNLARQRLMTATFNYYRLAHPAEGVSSGFEYRAIPKVSLQILTGKESKRSTAVYDCPLEDKEKHRVTGPFTLEAVPAPTVLAIDDGLPDDAVPKPRGDENEPEGGLDFAPDDSVARSGETARQQAWREELFATGINTRHGERLNFSRLDPLPGVWKHLHAEGEVLTQEGKRQKAVVSFGPAHAPLEQRQVELALREAQEYEPTAEMVVFAAFQFDPEAAKDIEEYKSSGQTILKAQMNPDLFTSDLKTKRSSSESFWLVGQPDVELAPQKGGKFVVRVKGFDYFDVRSGHMCSGGEKEIALWMLDTDYDGRSLLPSQVFFPMDTKKRSWESLAKTLKAVIDQELIEAYQGTESLPFEAGEYQRVAVKIVDNRGIESLKLIPLP